MHNAPGGCAGPGEPTQQRASPTPYRPAAWRPPASRLSYCPSIFLYPSASTFGLRSYVINPLISCSTSVSCV